MVEVQGTGEHGGTFNRDELNVFLFDLAEAATDELSWLNNGSTGATADKSR